MNLLKRLMVTHRVESVRGGRFTFSKDTDVDLQKTSKIVVEGGNLVLGFPLRNLTAPPSFNRTVLKMGDESKLIVKGDVFIGPGAFINICNGGELILDGGNVIAHNVHIQCQKQIVFEHGASVSWGCTLFDDDGHTMFGIDGKPIRRIISPLIIKKNCGIQMNVVIPRGITVGKNSIIGANSVLRTDVPDNCVAFTESTLKVKHGYTTGFELRT